MLRSLLLAAAARALDLKVGVAVVTYDRPRFLQRCLQNIADQTYPSERTEVFVIDDTEGDAARRAVEAATGRPLLCSQFVHLSERATIGAKRNRAAALAVAAGCDVVCTWDDDDVYGADRLAAQVAPLAAGAADATLATPAAWRWEGAGEAEATMTWGGALVPALLAAVDGDCAKGTEILDEAIASLTYRASLLDGAEYPDASYDEDREFLRQLRAQGARLKRLPPGAPDYVHVKHAAAAARGPLTDLHAVGLGALNSPLVFAGAVALASAAARGLLRPDG